MSGTVLSAFNDFVEGTGSTYVTQGNKRGGLINLGGKHTYIWPRLFGNNKSTLQGGEDIRASVVWSDLGTYEEYLPGASHDWQNPQRLDNITIDWRFTGVHWSWVDQELLLNDKIKYGNDKAKFEAFVSIRDEKELLGNVTLANGLENSLFRQPNKLLMEGQATTNVRPYSIFPFVNEHANGLFPSYTPGGAWTVVEGVDPTSAFVAGQFTPQQTTYSNATQDDMGNVISGLDGLYMDAQFEQPETMKQYFEDPRLNNQMILTTKTGRRAVMALIRGGQDRLVAGNQDPAVSDPMFHGIPIRRCENLETAQVYADPAGTALTTEGLANHCGPRFYMINGNYLYPIVHDERYMHKDKPTRHHNVPDTWVMFVATWWNLLCTSRKHQGILSPSTDVTAYYPATS